MSTPVCVGPTTAFHTYAWLPYDVRVAMRVTLDDPGLMDALAAVVQFPMARDEEKAAAQRVQAEVEQVRVRLRGLGLAPTEVLFFVAGTGAGVWAAPTGCGEPEVAADRLWFSSGQLWLVLPRERAGIEKWLDGAVVGPERAWVSGSLGTRLREGGAATLQVGSFAANDVYAVRTLTVVDSRLSVGVVRDSHVTPVRR